MSNFKEEYNNYVTERISNSLVNLKENILYKEQYSKYTELLKTLEKGLTKEQNQILDNIMSLLNALSDKELTTTYSIGLQDGIELKSSTDFL